MPASPPTLFGRVFQVFLSRADIDHRELGRYLGLDQTTIRDLEIGGMGGLGKTVLLTQQFYERLRHVPGFSDEAINLLEKAREIDELTEEFGGYLSTFRREMGNFELSDQQNLLLGEPLNKLDQEIAFELKVVKEEAQEPSSESFTDSRVDVIISPPMPSPEGENGDSLVKHISDLQSQAKFGAERKPPIHYPHENVVFHATQLQAEALGRQRTKKGSGKSYVTVATLREAAERTGVGEDEILTTGDIESEYHINKKLVHEYTKRGRRGRPHLTPLDVRLAGGGGGQLLFQRGHIERIVANPPKPGRTPK